MILYLTANLDSRLSLGAVQHAESGANIKNQIQFLSNNVASDLSLIQTTINESTDKVFQLVMFIHII